ncbi:MAG: YihY/virulence factor BrkB family protein [Oscillospiraceae bacterium]|nr:YihY/virulence factor BrkB family protein [Oscillospiraceae bacterium]
MPDFKNNRYVVRLTKLFRRIASLQVPLYSSQASYFIILSAFPLLVLVLTLVRFTGLDVQSLSDLVEGILPAALRPMAEKFIITTYYTATGAVMSVSAVTALWSAGRGVYALMNGLNAAYEVQETRSFLHTRLVCLLSTFVFLAVVLLTLVLQVFGNTILGFLRNMDGLLFRFLTEVVDLRFFLLLVLQTAVFTALYTALPNRKKRISQGIPGALLSSIGWLVFSDLFSIYVGYLSDFITFFGSVYALALSMLWLYFCICILFYGAALNHWLADRS